MLLLGFTCLIIFLFAVYQLAKDDYIFLRKGISTEDVFDGIFLALPVVIFFSRITFVFLHPSTRFLNPLVFLAIPYFPGLSLVGGIFGALIFGFFYTQRSKIPTFRFFDIVGISFLISFCIGILAQAAFTFGSNRIFSVLEIGQSLLGIAFFIFMLLKFLKGKWSEGTVAAMVLIFYCLLSSLPVGFMVLTRKSISFTSLILTGVLFIAVFIFFVTKEGIRKFAK